MFKKISSVLQYKISFYVDTETKSKMKYQIGIFSCPYYLRSIGAQSKLHNVNINYIFQVRRPLVYCASVSFNLFCLKLVRGIVLKFSQLILHGNKSRMDAT